MLLIIEHIDSLLDEECSRLEIIESLMSEFGSDYPDYDYTKWREIVTKRISETEAEDDEEEDLSFIPEPPVISVKDKYEQAKKKATKLIEWVQNSEKNVSEWSINASNKWAGIYFDCKSLLSYLEDDYSYHLISEDEYIECQKLYDSINTIFSQIPQSKLLKSNLSPNQRAIRTNTSTWRVFKSQLRHHALPINQQRRFAVDMPSSSEDLSEFILLSAEEKPFYTHSDLFVEKMSRIQPLLGSEENEYFKRLREGDEAARDAIIESTLPAIIAKVKEFTQDNCEYLFDDLLQDSLETVLKAFKYFKPNGHTNFCRYALACVARNIGTHLNNERIHLTVTRTGNSYTERPGYDEEYQKKEVLLQKTTTDKKADYFSACIEMLNMRRNKYKGELAPHKVILLLAIIEYIEKQVEENHVVTSTTVIPFRPALEQLFMSNWKKYVKSKTFQCIYITPIIHIQDEHFCSFVPIAGRYYTGSRNFDAIERAFKGIKLDKKMIASIKDSYYRQQLRKLLIDMI